MGFFKNISTGYKYVKCNARVYKAIEKSKVVDQKQYDKIVQFIGNYEFLRQTWTESLNLKTDKQKLAMFALVYYILVIYEGGDPFFWAEDKNEMTDSEEEHWDRVLDLFNYPISAYKDYILNNSGIFNVPNISEEFVKYKDHLIMVNFSSWLFNEELNKLINKYLLVFFNSDFFFEIDIMKDLIPIDEERGSINIKELENQIDRVIMITPDLGLNIEKNQFKLTELKIFSDTTLMTTLNNNPVFSFKSNFD